jgi:hypothetical protein
MSQLVLTVGFLWSFWRGEDLLEQSLPVNSPILAVCGHRRLDYHLSAFHHQDGPVI